MSVRRWYGFNFWMENTHDNERLERPRPSVITDELLKKELPVTIIIIAEH